MLGLEHQLLHQIHIPICIFILIDRLILQFFREFLVHRYGGLGCLGTPVVRTDAAGVWATGELWWQVCLFEFIIERNLKKHTTLQVPPISKIKLEGKLPSGVSGKDVIVALCSAFNNVCQTKKHKTKIESVIAFCCVHLQDEVLNHAVEFELTNGAELSVDDRLTIANMTTEFGCVAGLFFFFFRELIELLKKKAIE